MARGHHPACCMPSLSRGVRSDGEDTTIQLAKTINQDQSYQLVCNFAPADEIFKDLFQNVSRDRLLNPT